MAARVIEVFAENDGVLDAGLQAGPRQQRGPRELLQLRVEQLVFIHHVGGLSGGGLHVAVWVSCLVLICADFLSIFATIIG